MNLRTFEDLAAGERCEAGPVAVTREAIVGFAQMYDPQPFHLDEAAGAASLLGGLAASGWQTAALGMRLLYDGFLRHVASMGSPGIEELRWLKPVRPGDALRMALTTDAVRTSASRLDRGFLGMTMTMLNDADEAMMTQRFTVIVQRRGATQSGGPGPTPPSPAPLPSPEADPLLTSVFDDVPIGATAILGAQLFTLDTITSFARLYDPQYFHTDVEAARRSHFGGLCASGWQTAAYWMKHYVAAQGRSAEAGLAAGRPIAKNGPSPGFNDLKWLRPVYAGETLRFGLEVTGKRRIRRDGWALISTRNTAHLVTGDAAKDPLAFSFEGSMLWPLRGETG